MLDAAPSVRLILHRISVCIVNIPKFVRWYVITLHSSFRLTSSFNRAAAVFSFVVIRLIQCECVLVSKQLLPLAVSFHEKIGTVLFQLARGGLEIS